MNNVKYYAHSLDEKPKKDWQEIEEHLRNVAERAYDFAKPFDGCNWAFLAGLLHDIGKYSKEFQKKLSRTSNNDVNVETIAGMVDHSTGGAQHVNKLLKYGMGKLIAYAIAGHHSGLLDGKSNYACLHKRLNKKIPDYSSCPKNVLEHSHEIDSLPLSLISNLGKDNELVAFRLSFFVRMLFSCLVDADFLDTEAFFNEKKSLLRKEYPFLSELDKKLMCALAKIEKEAKSTDINIHRAEILENCLNAAKYEPGIFSLTVPTGGGKTLSSLAFAIKHAIKHGMERIIYVIPYTSIIEQNAKVFRSALGSGAVLEHHSNFDLGKTNYRSQLAAENWDAPVIVTTNVQFFESLFGSRTSKCRKLHNIANSVIILDEAQMLPVPLLKPCLMALSTLAFTYRTSIVLCTATQPALAKTEEFKDGLENVREIVPDPINLYKKFKRIDIKHLGKLKDSEISEKLVKHKQVLCIVNTRRHARLLYEIVKEQKGAYHLSALMCPAHRSERIKRIKECLDKNIPCRVISTQLIEAGVDIDFPVVFRSATGIDSVAQAAGRCNREGSLKEGKVYVFYPESGLPTGFFRQGAEIAETIARGFNDILSIGAIEEYFRHLYWKNSQNLDKNGILSLLEEGLRQIDFPFKEIGEKFKMIDNEMEPIIIPFNGEAEKIIDDLRYSNFTRSLLRKAQRFCVQVYPYALRRLEGISVERIQDRFPVLMNKDLYHDDIGLDFDNPTFRDIENLIC